MPYNTRRKSLSLPSLGIHVPVNRSALGTASTAMATTRPAPDSSDQPPSKRAKRSHTSDSSEPCASTSTNTAAASLHHGQHTPPLSPGAGVHSSIESDEPDAPLLKTVDLSSVNDNVVEAVITRLQETRNRPHLLKDLAVVLAANIPLVQQSPNPCAVVSSRLASFIKRQSWSAANPCPITKELEAIHPRRTYYYLNTCPHQPLPASSTVETNLVTPSLSSSISTEEDSDGDRRRELSLSPEIDLSSPEFDGVDDDVPIPGAPAAHASGRSRTGHAGLRSQRGDVPALEKDEKEFTQTADGLQRRRLVGGLLSAEPIDAPVLVDDGQQNDTLFGESHRSQLCQVFPSYLAYMTSPAMRPSIAPPPKRDGETEAWTRLDAMLDWDKSPETVELDELDGLLNGF